MSNKPSEEGKAMSIFPNSERPQGETEEAYQARLDREEHLLAPIRARLLARYEEIIAVQWSKLSLHCAHRKKRECHHAQSRGHMLCETQCEYAVHREYCPILKSMMDEMENTHRICYVDRKGFLIYVERGGHNRPWFIWHQERSSLGIRDASGNISPIRASSQVGAGKTTLEAAQVTLDRMAVRYGWEPYGMPDWVNDNVG